MITTTNHMKPAPLAQWLETAASFSLPGDGISRFFLTEEHRKLIQFLEKLMVQCGLETEVDAVGNLIGRKKSTLTDKVLYLGSHQDTVPGGGAYDGILGILVALSVMWECKHFTLPFTVEVIAFGDEEGSRFNSALLGSEAISGTFSEQALDFVDTHGILLKDALKDFGLDPEQISTLARNPDRALGYIEVHIEQGPILEEKDVPVGIVKSITGIERHDICVTGKAGHAGTVPMHLRHDALVAASQYINWLDSFCRTHDDVVGVVGQLGIRPNSVNVIPEEAIFTVELRSPHGNSLSEAREDLHRLTSRMKKQGFHVVSKQAYSLAGAHCDKQLSQYLHESLREEGVRPHYLFSGFIKTR